ncbi:hypothetical protein COS91_05845 [Candidatus Desantisbacteria bacterium CG07_land_8_20_14_0_80_39_15]|uniref:SWIM-type domain-containing protein n=1 Tax=Candidatus Desantisbacteria bacterium CG07_land_8_20_14_0_80_39_15 TaxID=1974549 RepID=A0A2M6ZFN3_9BACT|nr:MAG: hypothetical protein COS91_05845 [Candidatus Desantisbacteria bacterium CG07_land_8_20_14_0_80_39_15]
MGHWGYFPHYTPAEPKKVKDGIKLESKKIGKTWWSEKWINVLNSFGWSNRLQRGRSYARQGQIVNFKLEPGMVNAQVQGTASNPYTVKIKLKMFYDKEWNKIITAMSSRSVFMAKLLLGEMPPDIEEAFTDTRINLFPRDKKDIESDCSCPDWANPCKHIAATYYVLADEFDRDPFMIFLLRGRSKEQIIQELRKIRQEKSKYLRKTEVNIKKSQKIKQPSLALEQCLNQFWTSGEKLSSIKFSFNPAPVRMSLIKRLGTPVICREERKFLSWMKYAYRIASRRVSEIFLSDSQGNM